MKNEAIPRLRFKGFKNVWVNVQIKDICKRKDNLRKPVTASKRIKGNVPYYGANGIEDYVKGYTCDGSYLLIGEDESHDNKIINNYPVFKTKGKIWVNNHTHILIPKKNMVNLSFLLWELKHINLIKYLVGSNRYKLRSSDLMTIFVKSPSLPEQRLIGKFFAKLDKLIQLQQKKVALLKKLKQGYLQKLFPRKGESVPRLRFKGFHDKWKLNKLNKYLSIPKKQKAHVTKLNQIMTLKLHLKGLFKGSNRETLSLGSTNYYIRHAGQLLYGKQNFFHGSMSLIPKKFDGLATSSDIPSLDISGIDSHYLFIYISRYNFWKYSERYATGTGSMRLHEKDLMSMYIHVPSIREQEVIVKFVTELNDYLKYNQKQLAYLRKLKKAYLQKMFCQ